MQRFGNHRKPFLWEMILVTGLPFLIQLLYDRHMLSNGFVYDRYDALFTW